MFYDTLEEFYLAEALEYITAWQQATADNPAGICGPIGPTEQLPLVARLVNELGLDAASTRISGAWTNGSTRTAAKCPSTHPLSASRGPTASCASTASGPSCGCRTRTCISPRPTSTAYSASWDAGVRCAVMQGGQGEVKHWAFNDPPRREGQYKDDAAVAGRIPQARARAWSICTR